MENKTAGAIILIVNALFWAAMILAGSWFFADRPWGENLFLWGTLAFVVVNGLLVSLLGRRPRC